VPMPLDELPVPYDPLEVAGPPPVALGVPYPVPAFMPLDPLFVVVYPDVLVGCAAPCELSSCEHAPAPRANAMAATVPSAICKCFRMILSSKRDHIWAARFSVVAPTGSSTGVLLVVAGGAAGG